MWSFEGTGNSVTISYDETGAFKIFGELRTHYCTPSASHDFGFLDVMRDAELPFAVVSSGATELAVFSTFDKPNFFDRFRRKSTHSLARVNYCPKDERLPSIPSMLCLTIILSEQSEQRILDMYKSIFGRADLYHLITVEFDGLVRIPDNSTVEVPPDVLTVAEFLHPDLLSRKSHFSNKITFSLHTSPRLPPI
jgi:hypothetical protein